MGALRPRTADVARRLAAAIALTATMFVALVVGAGAAGAAPTTAPAAASNSTASAAPSSGALRAAGDLLVITGSALRGHDDPDSAWAEPATMSVLLAAPVAFFVGLTDTSVMSMGGRGVPQQRGRSPPGTAVPAPR